MISINIFQNESRKINGFSVRGHSHQAPRGKDVICAGVSALTQSACQGIIQYLGISASYSVSRGFLDFSFQNPTKETEAILQSMLIGLKSIQAICPGELSIFFQGEIFDEWDV